MRRFIQNSKQVKPVCLKVVRLILLLSLVPVCSAGSSTLHGQPSGSGFEKSAHEEHPLPEDSFPLLEQVLREAVDHSWRMIEEELQVEEARAEADVRASGRYPSVSGRFRFAGRLEDREDFDRTRSFYQPQAGLTVRQPLYHWGALQANSRIGRLRAAMAEGDRAEAYRELAVAIRSEFLRLAVQHQAIDLAEQRLALIQHELAIAKSRFAREEITPDELKDQELEAGEAELELARVRRNREFAMEEFSRLTGYEPAGDEWAPARIPVLDRGRANLPGDPKATPPWQDVSQMRIEQAEEQLAIEATRRRPQLDLVAGVSQDQVAVRDRSDIDRIVYFAGVELTWNLFDGHETRGRRGAALARKRLEERRHERQEREWTAELDRLEEGVDWAARQLAVSEKRLELAARNLSQGEQDLEQGRISEIELAALRVDHAEREMAATSSRAEYLMAVAEFFSEAGADPAMDYYHARQR